MVGEFIPLPAENMKMLYPIAFENNQNLLSLMLELFGWLEDPEDKVSKYQLL
jgi:hypothetical protein